MLGSVSFAPYMVSLHQKAYAFTQPGSLCVGRTIASGDLKAGDCVRAALSPGSPIPPAGRTPRGASAPDTWVGVSQSTGSIFTHVQHTMHPYLGKPAKIRENLSSSCVDSALEEKTFCGINKSRAWSGDSAADKCQMCKTKGALVLKTDQLQK